jgi:hypothetical protein
VQSTAKTLIPEFDLIGLFFVGGGLIAILLAQEFRE